MIDIKEVFGLNLKRLRKANDLTQEEFAESVGMGTKSINTIENGKQFPKIDNLQKICEVYKIYPITLFVVPEKIKNKSKSDLIEKIHSQLTGMSTKELELINKLIEAYHN